jgi:hypothetical protein
MPKTKLASTANSDPATTAANQESIRLIALPSELHAPPRHRRQEVKHALPQNQAKERTPF